MTRCKIWGSNTRVAESGGCVPCEAVLLGELFPTFWTITVPSASRVMHFQNCLTLEDAGIATLWYITKHPPNNVSIPENLNQTDKINTFIHSIGMCRMRQFPAVLKSFFRSPLLCTFSCYPSPPTILPSSLTSSCHPFLGLPLNLAVPKFIYNTLLGHGFWNFGILQPPLNYRRICGTTPFT